MPLTRISTCPCCRLSEFVVSFSHPRQKKITTWQQFFYGSSDFIADIFVCRHCNYRFINTICPDYEQYYIKQTIADSSSLDGFRHVYFNKIKNRLQSKYSCVDADVLDIGCGKGIWLDLWKNEENVFGSEYSVECIESLGEKNIAVLNQTEISQRKFDLISLFDVLEHLEDPFSFLQDVVGSLSVGGTLVIAVPDMGKLLAKMLGHRYYLVCPMHFSYFDRKSIRLLLERLFDPHNVHIEKSPTMNADLKGIGRWISYLPEIPERFNFKVPIPYRASLLCFATKK